MTRDSGLIDSAALIMIFGTATERVRKTQR